MGFFCFFKAKNRTIAGHTNGQDGGKFEIRTSRQIMSAGRWMMCPRVAKRISRKNNVIYLKRGEAGCHSPLFRTAKWRHRREMFPFETKLKPVSEIKIKKEENRMSKREKMRPNSLLPSPPFLLQVPPTSGAQQKQEKKGTRPGPSPSGHILLAGVILSTRKR